MAFRIKVRRDRGKKAFENLRLRMSQELELEVGIDSRKGSRQHPSRRGLTVASVGAIHELGLAEPHVPKRAFLAPWFSQNQSSIRAKFRMIGKLAFLKGLPLRQAGILVGQTFVREIQGQFGTIPPANRPTTIMRKGHALTLIDMGALKNSISARVTVKRGRL